MPLLFPLVPTCADSGASDIMLRQADSTIVNDRVPHSSLEVECANGTIMHPVEQSAVTLPFSSTPIPAYIFSDAELQRSHLSLSSICNSG